MALAHTIAAWFTIEHATVALVGAAALLLIAGDIWEGYRRP